jgi:hypothetical protein
MNLFFFCIFGLVSSSLAHSHEDSDSNSLECPTTNNVCNPGMVFDENLWPVLENYYNRHNDDRK